MDEQRGKSIADRTERNGKSVGRNLTQTARKVNGKALRTDNSVKNKFYSKFRKAIRNINELSQQSGNGKYK